MHDDIYELQQHRKLIFNQAGVILIMSNEEFLTHVFV
jgi:hypothetical protein